MERAMGIEPTSLAWEARVIPLYDARVACLLYGPGLPRAGEYMVRETPAAVFYGFGR
jgi:hypothetical protein